MKRTAQASILKSFNNPLVVQSYPLLDPEPGAAIARVLLAGVCGSDVHLQHGHYPIPLPNILGHETVGVIEKIGGMEIKDLYGNPLQEGDLVLIMSSIPCGQCYFCRVLAQRNLCEKRFVYGVSRSSNDPPHFCGGYGEFLYLFPGTGLIKIPSHLTPEEAISLGCAGPTAVNGVLYQTKITAGDVVVIQGAGPVGIAAALIARISGAKKILLLGGPASRIDFIERRKLADWSLNIFEVTAPEERVKMVIEQTEGKRGADVVLECAGFPEAVQEGWKMVRRDGKYLVLGHYTDRGPIMLNPSIITQKQMKIFGSWAFVEPHYLRYVELLPLFKRFFPLEEMITFFSLAETNQALRAVENGEVIKAVIRP
ncbi:MAG: zinc-binding dehydrogenase [Thermodesulfobacteriota bacterium]